MKTQHMSPSVYIVIESVEKRVGKGQNGCYKYFLLHKLFSKASFLRKVKTRKCVVKGLLNLYQMTNCRLVQLERIADDKIYSNEQLKFLSGRVENIMGKGENAGNYQHFLLFPKCFQKALSSGLFYTTKF